MSSSRFASGRETIGQDAIVHTRHTAQVGGHFAHMLGLPYG